MNFSNTSELVMALKVLADRIERGEVTVIGANGNVTYGVDMINYGNGISRKVPSGHINGSIKVEYKGFRSMK